MIYNQGQVEVIGAISGKGANVDYNNNIDMTLGNDVWATDITIPAGTVACIASGQEYTCGNLTIYGTLMNMGYLRCKSITTEAGSTYITGLGSTTEIFAGY